MVGGSVRRAPRIVSFILPLGYSFNLDGSTLYCLPRRGVRRAAANVDLTMGGR
jgi:Na+/H+-dicarboxylate symporter